jgi:hypothetical protein
LKVLVAPGARVRGTETPLTLKPEPLARTWETVKLAEPLFFSWIVCEFALPVTTEPKLALDGVTLMPACTPVPVTAAIAFVDSLLVTVILPATVVLVVGANVTVKGTLCDGAMVAGTASPLTEMPAPLAATCVIVTLEFPVLASCTVCLAELPTFTFPKLALPGVSDMV